MLETVEATIDTLGNVVLAEKKRLGRKHRALVTILDEEPPVPATFKLVGSLEIIGDIETGSREISEMFRGSVERSAEDVDL